MEKTKIGFAMCGSFCMFEAVFKELEGLALRYDVTPIMSETAYSTNTRFGKAEEHRQRAETICGKGILHSIPQVEPIGPKKLFDLIVVAPCTGNTLAKLATGISDSAVSLAVKAHLRNRRPVLIAVSSNDALAANAKNIGILMNTRNMFFVPFRQDDAIKKTASAVADMSLIGVCAEMALQGMQMQPLLR